MIKIRIHLQKKHIKLHWFCFSETKDTLACYLDLPSSICNMCCPFCQQLGVLHYVDLLTNLHEEDSSFWCTAGQDFLQFKHKWHWSDHKMMFNQVLYVLVRYVLHQGVCHDFSSVFLWIRTWVRMCLPTIVLILYNIIIFLDSEILTGTDLQNKTQCFCITDLHLFFFRMDFCQHCHI